MRAMSRAAVFVATAVLLGSGTAYARGAAARSGHRATVASAQAEATAAADRVHRRRAPGRRGRGRARRRQGRRRGRCRRPRRRTTRRTSPPPPPPRPRRRRRSRPSTRRPPPPPRPRPPRPPPTPTRPARPRRSRSSTAARGPRARSRCPTTRRCRPSTRATTSTRRPRPRPLVSRRGSPLQRAGKSCPAFNPSKCPGFSALNFLHYENLGYDVMVANGTPGLSVWSLKDPAHPKYIAGARPRRTIAREDAASTLTQFWEGENMTVDSRRKLAFMSRDSRPQGHHHDRRQGPVEPEDHQLPEDLAGPHGDLPQRLPLHVVGRWRRAPAPAKLRGLRDRHP